jgi:hypothetical protein
VIFLEFDRRVSLIVISRVELMGDLILPQIQTKMKLAKQIIGATIVLAL